MSSKGNNPGDADNVFDLNAQFAEIVDGFDSVEDDGQPIRVADWTPEDYSRVYVRYRPQLVRHVSRFLSEPSDVDEVVQDAFLYLFLSLPELDSEIGVLKFLKWKSKLLALDVLRAQGKRPSLVDVSDESQTSDLKAMSAYDEMELADDAALVHAALARIPERQREALLRAEFQEQSMREIGAEMGISENNVRQLVHRARKSFKDQLLAAVGGDSLQVSQVLSVAVRKAKEAGVKGIAMIVVLALPLLVGLGWQPLTSAIGGDSDIAAPAEQPVWFPVSDGSEGPASPSTSADPVDLSADDLENAESIPVRKRPSADPTRVVLSDEETLQDSDAYEVLTSDDLVTYEAAWKVTDEGKLSLVISSAQTGVSMGFVINPDQTIQDAWVEVSGVLPKTPAKEAWLLEVLNLTDGGFLITADILPDYAAVEGGAAGQPIRYSVSILMRNGQVVQAVVA